MAPDLAQLTKDIQQKASALVPNNEQLRQSLLQSARNLVAALETPGERIARMVYLDTSILAATRVLVDLKVFRILSGSGGPINAAQIAKECGADVRMLERLLKHVSVENFVQEVGPDEYVANDITRLLASPEGEGVVKNMYCWVKMADRLPSYFKETNYVNPAGKDKSVWHDIMGQHYFEYIAVPGREEEFEAFHNHMRFRTLCPNWYNAPKIMEAVFGSVKLSSEDVLLVDVGGGTGHDIIGFHRAHTDIPGRLILQDLPSTIESLDSDAMVAQGVEPMAHDFFTPQPVKHAKAYYLKMVLHDWPDEQCKEILSNLKPALKPGYSGILLNEIVIPDMKAGWFETSFDILMMAVHGSQERREGQWRALVEDVGGLKVNRIWDVEGTVEKVIEIELA